MMSASSSYSNDVTSLHKAIEENEIDEVKLLLSKLPVDKHYFDLNNNSAAAVAIKCEKHNIYELLVAKGIFLGPHERMDEATSGQDKSEKVKLREIHRKYFSDPNLKHLINLITSTKLSHEASPSDRREHLRLITGAFEDLNDLKSIVPILKVASKSSKLRIVFDFNRDSVEFLDPVKNRNVIGTSYTENCIVYVGAKDLKEKEKRCEVLGVLIHELTHFVMKLVYDNEAKPYHHGDQEKLNEFSQVVIDTAEKKESEPYIKSVYDYPKEHHHAELIVRVPQLTALYKNEADKTIEVQDEYSELFDFYEKNTLVDLIDIFPLMEAKHEIRELNELCGTLALLEKSDIKMSSQAWNGLDLNSLSNDKIFFISSNCPQLTFSAVFQKVRTASNSETSFIFADLKSMRNDMIFGLAVKALALFTNPRMIIDCQGMVRCDEVMGTVNKLKENKVDQKVIFIIDTKYKDSCNSKSFEILHSWNHLSSDFQQKLLGKKIEFHGTEMAIGELLNDLSSLESIPLQDLLDNKTIVIGKKINFETEKMIERKFLPFNSKADPWGNYTIEHDLDELVAVTNEHKTILISDEPGMGKSTSFKMLHSNLRLKNPTLWLVFMDLKDHFKAYNVSCLEIRKREDIAKFFTERVLKIESLEAEIFTQLFNEGRVVLLMDGLDEICPSYKQFIFSLMRDVQKFSKNQLWISTRPHLVAELKNELNPIEFALKPFTETNRREFFEKHFIGDPNFELILEGIESFLVKLRNNVFNPLVMRMIVEILDEDRSLKLSEANLFVVYDRFTRKMIEKCLDKGSEARRDIANMFGNIVEFYQQQAFITCFGNRHDERKNAVKREKLIDSQFYHVKKPPLDEIVRIGLMFASSSEDFYFIHRTFAEFYVAKFFYEAIFKFTNLRAEKLLNETIELLIKIISESNEFKFIIILLDNAVGSDKKLSVEKFLPSTLKVVRRKMEREHFEFLIKNGCYNLIEIFVLHLHPDAKRIIFNRIFFILQYYQDINLIMVAVENQSVEFVKQFVDLLNDLNSVELKEMFYEFYGKRKSALAYAALNPNAEVIEYLIEFCESFMTSEEINVNKFGKDRNLLNYTSEKPERCLGHNFFCTQKPERCLSHNIFFTLNYLFGVYFLLIDNVIVGLVFVNFIINLIILILVKVLYKQSFKNPFLEEKLQVPKAFEFSLMRCSESFFLIIKKLYFRVFGKDVIRQTLFHRNNCENWFEESSLYFRQMCSRYIIFNIHNIYYCDGAFKRFISFIMEFFAVESIQKEFFIIKDDKDETFLEFAMKNLEKNDFSFLCSLLLNANYVVEVLQQKNSRGECAFHWAAKRENLEGFRKFLKLYEESFNKKTFRQMIVSCDNSWLYAAVRCFLYRLENSETFAELCQYLSKLFKGTDETERLKPFFLFANKWSGKTAFMVAAEGKNKEFENLFDLTKELFDIGTVKEFLLLKDTNGATAFSHSFESGEVTTIEFVIDIHEELFGREKLKDFVMPIVQNGNILWQNINGSPTPGSFEILCNFLINLFEGEARKLKNCFVSVHHDMTVLMKAAKELEYNRFQVLINVIEKVFIKEEIVELLCQRNRQGKTALHYARENSKIVNFETVKKFYCKKLGKEALRSIIFAEVNTNYHNHHHNHHIIIMMTTLYCCLIFLFVLCARSYCFHFDVRCRMSGVGCPMSVRI